MSDKLRGAFHGCPHHGDDYEACIQHSGTAPCGVTEELEHTQGQRDAAIKRAQAAEDMADALAAYAERIDAPATAFIENADEAIEMLRTMGDAVTIEGEQYAIVDIGMRMLQPHELAQRDARMKAEGAMAVHARLHERRRKAKARLLLPAADFYQRCANVAENMAETLRRQAEKADTAGEAAE